METSRVENSLNHNSMEPDPTTNRMDNDPMNTNTTDIDSNTAERAYLCRVTALHALDPAVVGAAATDLVLCRVGRLVCPLAPGVRLDLYPPAAGTGLAFTVAQLCRWAQTGHLGDWIDHEDAADALLTCAEALYASPLRDWSPEDIDAAVDLPPEILDAAVDLPRGGKPSDVALVLACALNRLRLHRGEAVAVPALAWLAGLSHQRLHQLSAAGELAVAPGQGSAPGTVAAPEARRWLAAQGLRGY